MTNLFSREIVLLEKKNGQILQKSVWSVFMQGNSSYKYLKEKGMADKTKESEKTKSEKTKSERTESGKNQYRWEPVSVRTCIGKNQYR